MSQTDFNTFHRKFDIQLTHIRNYLREEFGTGRTSALHRDEIIDILSPKLSLYEQHVLFSIAGLYWEELRK